MQVGDSYLGVAQAIAGDRGCFSNLEVSDTKLMPRDHPAIRGFRDYANVIGKRSFTLTYNMLNGFYLSGGIVVSLDG